MNVLFEADQVLRTRQLTPTSIELKHLKNRFKSGDEQALLSKALKGGKDAGTSCRALLCTCFTNGTYEKGQMVPIQSQMATLCKLMYAAHIANVTPPDEESLRCHCLPQVAFMAMGCNHVRVPFYTPRVAYSRLLCPECCKCYRCGKCLGFACGTWVACTDGVRKHN